MCAGLLALFILFAAGTVSAADRALIIGVGEYEDPGVDGLSGIDLDVNMMKDNAGLLGFSGDEIRILSDAQATGENIRQSISSWLGSAGENDRVLLYYSGHGSRIRDESGDEEDGQDEVILGYDTRVVRRNGHTTLTGVVVDDDMEMLLKNLRSRDVLVLFDSCHSGTASKGLRLDLQTRDMHIERLESKAFYYEGMSRGIAAGPRTKGDERYVLLSACRDDEESAASTQGSIFTLGLSRAVKKAAAENSLVTPQQLQRAVDDFVEEQAASNSRVWRFHPQISGNKTHMGRNIFVENVSDGNGPGWRRLDKLYRLVGNKTLELELRESYLLGDPFEVSVMLDEPGYLLLLYVDAADEITILYPNKYNPDGHVTAGRVSIPGPDMNFDLTITRPAGKHQVVAFWGKSPFSSYFSGRKAVDDVFAVMSAKSMKELSRGIGISQRRESDDMARLQAGRAVFIAR